MLKGLVSKLGYGAKPKPKNVPNIVSKIVEKVNRTWPQPTKFLAGGANGKVYETEEPGVLLKIVAGEQPQEFMALQKLQNARYGNQRIVPAYKRGQGHVLPLTFLSYQDQQSVNKNLFKRNTHGGKLTVFLMGRVGNGNAMTLRKYITTFGPSANVPRVQGVLKRLVEEMHYRGIGHGNLHGGNIIVSANSDGKIKGIWIIDFGRAHAFRMNNTHSGFLSKSRYRNKIESWNEITRGRPGPHNVMGYWNGNGVISRPNVGMLLASHNVVVPKNWEENIAKLRRQVAAVAIRKPSSSPRRVKTLSPRRKRPQLRRTKSLSSI